MKTLNKIMGALVIIALIGAIAFVDYGVKTQCPDVAVYVKCFGY